MDSCNYIISSLFRMLPKHRSDHKIWITNEENALYELVGSCQKRYSRYCQMLHSLQFLNRPASSLYQSLIGSVTVPSRFTYWKGKIEGINLETTVNLLLAETLMLKLQLRWSRGRAILTAHLAVTVHGDTCPDLAACLHLQLPSSSHTTLTSWAKASTLPKNCLRHTHPSKNHDSDELHDQTGKC